MEILSHTALAAGGSLSERCGHALQLRSGKRHHVEQVGCDALLHCRMHGLGMGALLEAAMPHATVAGILPFKKNHVRFTNPIKEHASNRPCIADRSPVNQCAASLFCAETIPTIFRNYETRVFVYGK